MSHKRSWNRLQMSLTLLFPLKDDHFQWLGISAGHWDCQQLRLDLLSNHRSLDKSHISLIGQIFFFNHMWLSKWKNKDCLSVIILGFAKQWFRILTLTSSGFRIWFLIHHGLNYLLCNFGQETQNSQNHYFLLCKIGKMMIAHRLMRITRNNLCQRLLPEI